MKTFIFYSIDKWFAKKYHKDRGSNEDVLRSAGHLLFFYGLFVTVKAWNSSDHFYTGTNKKCWEEMYMKYHEKVSTGIPGFDKTIDMLRMGDNVVWQID